jgi:cytochrome c peroxidase
VTKKNDDWDGYLKYRAHVHDGSLKTLEDVVEFYDKGAIPNKNLDEKEPDERREGQGDGASITLAAPTEFPQ